MAVCDVLARVCFAVSDGLQLQWMLSDGALDLVGGVVTARSRSKIASRVTRRVTRNRVGQRASCGSLRRPPARAEPAIDRYRHLIGVSVAPSSRSTLFDTPQLMAAGTAGGGAMASIRANGAMLYYELRGHGPSLLLISGATGDAGHWTGVADVLADEYAVITYDRRGNSRSPRPPGWTSTTVDEQADDAAALLSRAEPGTGDRLRHERRSEHRCQSDHPPSGGPARRGLT